MKQRNYPTINVNKEDKYEKINYICDLNICNLIFRFGNLIFLMHIFYDHKLEQKKMYIIL